MVKAKAKKAVAKKTPKNKGRANGAPKEYQIRNTTPAITAAVRQVAAEFRAAMESAGLTEETLAKKLKVSDSRVWQLLDGRTISLRTMVEVFAACGKKFKIVAG